LANVDETVGLVQQQWNFASYCADYGGSVEADQKEAVDLYNSIADRLPAGTSLFGVFHAENRKPRFHRLDDVIAFLNVADNLLGGSKPDFSAETNYKIDFSTFIEGRRIPRVMMHNGTPLSNDTVSIDEKLYQTDHNGFILQYSGSTNPRVTVWRETPRPILSKITPEAPLETESPESFLRSLIDRIWTYGNENSTRVADNFFAFWVFYKTNPVIRTVLCSYLGITERIDYDNFKDSVTQLDPGDRTISQLTRLFRIVKEKPELVPEESDFVTHSTNLTRPFANEVISGSRYPDDDFVFFLENLNQVVSTKREVFSGKPLRAIFDQINPQTNLSRFGEGIYFNLRKRGIHIPLRTFYRLISQQPGEGSPAKVRDYKRDSFNSNELVDLFLFIYERDLFDQAAQHFNILKPYQTHNALFQLALSLKNAGMTDIRSRYRTEQECHGVVSKIKNIWYSIAAINTANISKGGLSVRSAIWGAPFYSRVARIKDVLTWKDDLPDRLSLLSAETADTLLNIITRRHRRPQATIHPLTEGRLQALINKHKDRLLEEQERLGPKLYYKILGSFAIQAGRRMVAVETSPEFYGDPPLRSINFSDEEYSYDMTIHGFGLAREIDFSVRYNDEQGIEKFFVRIDSRGNILRQSRPESFNPDLIPNLQLYLNMLLNQAAAINPAMLPLLEKAVAQIQDQFGEALELVKNTIVTRIEYDTPVPQPEPEIDVPNYLNTPQYRKALEILRKYLRENPIGGEMMPKARMETLPDGTSATIYVGDIKQPNPRPIKIVAEGYKFYISLKGGFEKPMLINITKIED